MRFSINFFIGPAKEKKLLKNQEEPNAKEKKEVMEEKKVNREAHRDEMAKPEETTEAKPEERSSGRPRSTSRDAPSPPPEPCPCPLRPAWGNLDALVGRLRAAFEENGGQPEANPFAARAVRLYLREVRDSQAKARGIAYEKKKIKRPPPPPPPPQQPQPPVPMAPPAVPPVNICHIGRAAAELNLVNGGYPHPLLMMPAMDDGAGDEAAAVMAVGDAHSGGGMIPLSVFN